MNKRDIRFEPHAQGFCLRNPPHPAESGDIMCRICGALIQDVFFESYQVKRLLGSGRSGQAYLAVDQRQQQPVVLKIFPPDPASQHLWVRAWREMNQVAAFGHRSTLPVLNCALWNPGTHRQFGSLTAVTAVSRDKKVYLSTTCQYAPFTLNTLLAPADAGEQRAVRLSIRQLVHLIVQATSVLSLAHDLGIVHGALVPGNFLLDAQLDNLWIADFGFARLHPPPRPFLAPELAVVSNTSWQIENMELYWEAATAASDQFAFAVLCDRLLTPAMQPDTAERVLPVIQRASHPDPALRFKRIADFVSALVAAIAITQPLLGESSFSSYQNSGTTHLTQDSGGNTADQRHKHTAPLFPHTAANEGESAIPVPLPLQPAPAPPSPASEGAAQWEQTAGKFFAAHNYSEAERAYLQASRLEPEKASVWFGLGDTYFALKRYTSALRAYGQALTLDPNNAEGWFNRATVLEMLGMTDQAALDYERAEQLRAEAARRSEHSD